MGEITEELDSIANDPLDESEDSQVQHIDEKKQKSALTKKRQLKLFFKSYWREITIGIFICYCLIQFDKLNGIQRDMYYLERTVESVSSEVDSISSNVDEIQSDVWSVKYDLENNYKENIESIKDAVMYDNFLSGSGTVYEKTKEIYYIVNDIKDSIKTY